MKKQHKDEAQMSLFEVDVPLEKKKQSEIDVAVERFEQNPNMNKEEYKRWIRYLVQVSLRSME